MFERWKLQDYAPGDGLAAGAEGEDLNDAAWIPVDVPGDVHRALLAAGRIEDPFYDRNEDLCAWMEGREWWYRTRFTPPDPASGSEERLQLVFHGLDTFATVYLNGSALGTSSNMFRDATFDVTALLRAGENTLAVRFDRPLDHIAGIDVRNWGDRGDLPRIAMRKAQFGYGWDWGPRLPTIGIWRPVELVRRRGAAIAGIDFQTLHLSTDHRCAAVAVRIEVDRFATQAPLQLRVRLSPPGGATAAPIEASVEIAADGAGSATLYLTVPDPQLWWTHDLGTPALYSLDVGLHEGDTCLDRREQRVGIRTIALDQSPDMDEPGARHFRFVLNGVGIFAKGANWIPADSFVGAIPEGRYASLLGAARDGNMNMLRVWGGGLYEHDAFYDICDRLGLLVWQDFMFACAPYPQEQDTFIAEVREEALYQVRRLRAHPSLALWCGNNENQWIADQHNTTSPGVHVRGQLYYDTILPEAVAELDGHTPYWPGSPYGGDDHNSQEDGDRHNWDVWHGMSPRRFGEPLRVDHSPAGVDYRRYTDDRGRFISEFGMHAAPVLATLERVIPPDQRYHHSPSMDHHNKDNPKNKGDSLMIPVTGLPDSLEQYIDFSMIAQAEGLKFGVEHYRRRMPHCSGTLVWQLNDCWPVLSWSLIDYYGFGKAGYSYLSRAYAPVLASFKPLPDGAVELWLTNDRRVVAEGIAHLTFGSLSGQSVRSEELPFRIEPYASRAVHRLDAERLAGGDDRYLAVRSPGDIFPANRHFFAAIKDLPLGDSPVGATMTPVPGGLEVRLKAGGYAYFVHLISPEERLRYSDNYLDLLPGEERAIMVRSTDGEPVTPEAIQVRQPRLAT